MLRYLTAGESHGRCLVAILEGLPAGLKVDEEIINLDLRRRQLSIGRGPRMAIEYDTIQILSGLRKKVTIGSPIALLIENEDTSINSLPSVTRPRPGHADLGGVVKYDRSDIRDVLERASARETAIRVALGGVCKILLDAFDIEILSHVVELGGIKAHVGGLDYEELKKRTLKSSLNCVDKRAEKEMIKKIEAVGKSGNTLGGVCEIIAVGVPVGLGSYAHSDRRLDARIAGALMSIQAIKGVEIGPGFRSAALLGSEVHDEIIYDRKKGFSRKTNSAGGIEG
ncbi:MAG: chorismate synthase, partial [Omnitrophica WOR_2 bacterium SM23_29]